MTSATEFQFGHPARDNQQIPGFNTAAFDLDDLPCLDAPGPAKSSIVESLETDSGSPERTMVQVGSVIADRYTVVEVISQTCFTATDEVNGKSVLVKAAHGSSQELCDLATAVQRSSEISHPSLIRVVGFHQTVSRAFIISESVDGRSLGEELIDRGERDQRFTIEEVIKVAIDVCGCLKACHARMSHGGISVETIFITSDGSTRLADYGLPCSTGDTSETERNLQSAASRAKDLRDLAAVLYELLTGECPGALPVAPHLIRNSIPPRLSQAILKELTGRRIVRAVSPHIFERRLTRATKLRPHPAIIVVSVLLACVATAAVISRVRAYQTRQAELQAFRLAGKPEYAKRLGELTQMQKQAEALIASLASESKRLGQEVEKCEKELANAEDGNKTTQAANARRKLEVLRPQSEMVVRIQEHWNRYQHRQQWKTEVAGLLSAAEMLANDESYGEAVESLKTAEVIMTGIVTWHSSIQSRLEEMDQLSTRLDESVTRYESLTFAPYSEPQRLFQNAQTSLTSVGENHSGNILKSVSQLLDSIDELMPLRLEVEQLRQPPNVVSELPELHEQYRLIDELLVTGDRHLESGNTKNAGRQYRQARAGYREIPVMIVDTLLSMVHASRNPPEALHLLDEALLVPLDDDHDQKRRQQVYLSRADVRIELGDLKGALDDLNTVIRMNSENAAFYAKRADLWDELQETDAAITDYERAISLDDAQVDAGIRLAELYAASGKPELAIERYGWVLVRRPDDRRTRLARATISVQAGLWSVALDDSRHVLTRDQSLLVAWQIRTMADYELGNVREAIEDSSRLITIAPDSAMGYAYRAAAYLEADQLDAAIKDSTTAIRMDPSSVWCYRIRAKARFGKGETDSAQQDYQLAMRLAANESF